MAKPGRPKKVGLAFALDPEDDTLNDDDDIVPAVPTASVSKPLSLESSHPPSQQKKQNDPLPKSLLNLLKNEPLDHPLSQRNVQKKFVKSKQ